MSQPHKHVPVSIQRLKIRFNGRYGQCRYRTILLCKQITDAHGYETSVVGKHRCGNQILKTIAGIVGRTLDCVETSAIWTFAEFGMLSIDPRAARKAGREKSCNSQHSAKLPSHCEISVRG